ncbi:MAG: hypothetical protein JW869_06645 [Candidatus Omnitrophica bacterium]|nr:hypothetical protein [Candidatus Omnitrophota bacterium]
MAEDIKGLIDKIQQEGIKAAEEKAREIEDKANQRAQGIIEEAEQKAARLIDNARDEVAKMEKNSRVSLEQVGRDLLLSLHEEINAMLKKIALAQVQSALGPEEMSKIIGALIKEMNRAKEGQVVVTLGEKDLKKVEQGILHKLGSQIKKELTLKPSGEISGGFIISYDGSKSHFDFTDKALAEYLSARLKPKLAELIQQAVLGGGKGKGN